MNHSRILLLLFAASLTLPTLAQKNTTGDPEYLWTSFYDSFDSEKLNSEKWEISSPALREKGLFIWADTATVKQKDGSLLLSMKRHPGYSAVYWNGDTVTADFIGGQVQSTNYFRYGIFECNALFANKRGSFPAFWLYNDFSCRETYRNEIDIVELKRNFIAGTLDNTIWFYPVDCAPPEAKDVKNNWFINWNIPHTFKLVWTPYKIEYWLDDRKLHEIINDGQKWFPDMPVRIILSQQLTRFGWLDPSMDRIVTPQTSHFNWVRVREFFKAPEIEYSGNPKELKGSAILDADSLAHNITWKLSPTELFKSSTEGSGKTAKFIFADNAEGEGNIIFRFEMPSGEFFYVEKRFQINTPD